MSGFNSAFKGLKYLEDIDIDGRIILKYILRKEDQGLCTQLICLRIGTHGHIL